MNEEYIAELEKVQREALKFLYAAGHNVSELLDIYLRAAEKKNEAKKTEST